MLSSIQWYVTSTHGLLLYTYIHLFTLVMNTELALAKILFYDTKYFQIQVS